MATLDERFQKGLEIRQRLAGGQGRMFRGAVPMAYELAPDMYRISTECLYGSIWSRPGLDLKYRAMATLTVAAIQLAALLPERFKRTPKRLSDRGVLGASGPELESVIERLNSGMRWSVVSSLISGTAMMIAFAMAWGLEPSLKQATLMAVKVAIGLVFGAQLGRMVSYARLGHVLTEHEVP